MRTVVYGGQPDRRKTVLVTGGTKKSFHYSYNKFAYDSQRLEDSDTNSNIVAKPPPYSTSLGVNLVNVYCRGGDKVPLEFRYREATHIMDLTAQMARNANNRWQVAARKVWR